MRSLANILPNETIIIVGILVEYITGQYYRRCLDDAYGASLHKELHPVLSANLSCVFDRFGVCILKN